MIRPVAVLLSAVVGSSAIHPAATPVETGGPWDQPGFSTFYRAPGVVLDAPAAPQHRPGSTPHRTASSGGDALHEAAHLLRSAAWDLDQSRKKAKGAVDAETKIEQALTLLRQ